MAHTPKISETPARDEPNAPPASKARDAGKEVRAALINNFLSTATFTAFSVAVLTYMQTVAQLPQHWRSPVYVPCVIVMVIILAQFGLNTVLLAQKKHEIDIAKTQHQYEEDEKLQRLFAIMVIGLYIYNLALSTSQTKKPRSPYTSYLLGMASILDFGNTLADYGESVPIEKDDFAALRAEWQAIDEDMRDSMLFPTSYSAR